MVCCESDPAGRLAGRLTANCVKDGIAVNAGKALNGADAHALSEGGDHSKAGWVKPRFDELAFYRRQEASTGF